MTSNQPDDFNFEGALAELNQLVEKMERGGVNLEESLQDFEKGIHLTRQCQQALKVAEQKVHMLLEKNGTTLLTPYQPDMDENP